MKETYQTEDIQLLIIKELMGSISNDERTALDEWHRLSAENEAVYQWLSNPEHHEAEYHFRKTVDTEEPRIEMEERIARLQEGSRGKMLRMPHLFKYAAAILVMAVAGATLWYNQYTKVTPPEISESVQLAMQQSIESGMQEAEIAAVSGSGMRDLEVSGERVESSTGEQEQGVSLSSESLSSLTKEQLLSAKRITTKHDKEYWVTLDDGTLVHLNYNTRLIYPEKFGRGNRNVILDGEAYFMVAKDKSRPFIVHTPDGDVKVYGTEFNVNTRGESPNTQSSASIGTATSVVLLKGSISFTPTAGKEQMLKPGQKLSILNSQFSIEDVDTAPYLAWNEGKFSFEEWSLDRIMQVISRWYGREVEFTADDIKHQQYSGNFDRYEDIHPTMEAIETITGLKITLTPDKLIIEP